MTPARVQWTYVAGHLSYRQYTAAVADYRFVTEWKFDAPIGRVWTEVGDPLNWRMAWPGLENVRALDPGAPPEPGATYELVFKSFLPYRLTLAARIDEHVEPRRIVMSTTGELEGTAEFDLEEVDGATRTRLLWTTRTTKAWMNALSFLLGGLFEWNHDVLMGRAGKGLARCLGVDVSQAEGTAPPLVRALLPVGVVTFAAIALARRLRI